MKILTLILSLFLLQSTLHAQMGKTPKGFTEGKTKKGRYVNKYFDLTIHFDKDWHVNGKKRKKEISKQGKRLIRGTRGEQEVLEEVLENNVHNMLFLQEHDPKDGVPNTTSFICLAENLTANPAIITTEDYMDASKSMISKMDLPYEFDEGYTDIRIGKRNFKSMVATLDFGTGIVVHQLYVVSVVKGFALSFVCTYTNETEKKQLMRVLKYIKMG